MSWEKAQNAIRTRFRDQVETPQSLAGKVQYDNVELEKPQDTEWIRFTVLQGASLAASIGSKRFRNTGVAIAQVFTPVGKGDKDAVSLADVVRGQFRAVTVSGVGVSVTFRTPSLTRVGRDGKWHQINVSCPFFWDETV